MDIPELAQQGHELHRALARAEERIRTADTPQILAVYVEAAVSLRSELDALSQSATRGNAVGRPTDPGTTRSRS